MKKLIILVVIALFALAGCSNDATTEKVADTSAQTEPAAHSAPADGWSGSVVETMNSGGYTYVLMDTGTEQKWVAGPETTVAVGDKVAVQQGMPMKDFTSKTLDRVFDVVYFVGAIEMDDGHSHDAPATLPAGGMGGMGGMAGSAASGHTTTEIAGVEGVERLEGGFTVAQIFTGAADLGGRTIKVRGRVVKFTPNIMGTNWVHIQDGTGSQGTHDLTVTTASALEVGSLVVVEGALAVNKDFGAGYKYAAIIENATVTVE